MPTPIAALLQRRRRSGAQVHYELAPDWQQGRTTFGGLISTLATQAMHDVSGDDWPLRALQASFIGPVSGDLVVDVALLRQGRHVRQVQATARSQGAVAAVFHGIFGDGRASALPRWLPTRPAVERAPDDLPQLPFVPGLSPAFLQNLHIRWAEGDLPYTGGSAWQTRIHLRLREPAGLAGELMTVLLADMPPTPALGHFSQPTMASSVSWELELLPRPAGFASDGWWRVDTEVVSAAEGYVNQRSTLWAPDGALAALGYQVVAVFG